MAGYLLVADFAPHDHEELRDARCPRTARLFGHQMESWFAASGHDDGPIETLGGGTLTVKLWLARKRANRNLN
jgi:hypothetical protein